MDKYDIKHPLGGPEFENIQTGKLDFKDKVNMIVNGKDSYLNYKKDYR